jgi:hypothetical protein
MPLSAVELSVLPTSQDCARLSVPWGSRIGQGDRASPRGTNQEANGLFVQPLEPYGADQQPCGTDESNVPVSGEHTVQVASQSNVAPVCGADTRRNLEQLGTAQARECR